ncbi:hypothetical protein FIBSPDRAFT_849189 [Athelia psychrophila]|uniref:Uncharacterized protein n=1 Tax=Athelia psychrophila TaxID=1759441 RepID=A0A166UHS2_9AGAM|nr:hypothetical protein FIBSPDRAFT_849187 [Fibularhizoctonia sp. CBS 109695]KZP31706.1 hypothetical protein FIBSPDRAFT_849189 [Fibularhizoctonia sp. CBS 109695]
MTGCLCRCLFGPLAPPLGDSGPAKPRTVIAHPLPFLEQLYSTANFAQLDVNAYDGYALTKAVYANFIPLIRFFFTIARP